MPVMTLTPPTGHVPPEDRPFYEYPKWVGKVIVTSREEEDAILKAGDASAAVPAPKVSNVTSDILPAPTLQGPNDEMELLLAAAEKKGIRIDKRWGIKKLRKAVADAK